MLKTMEGFVQNVDLFKYCPLIFYIHLLLVIRQITQSIQWIPREQAASKKLRKIYVYTEMSEKWGVSHTNQEKSGQSYILLKKKRGLIIYTWQRWKRGPFGTHIHNMPYIGSYPFPPPPPPTHTHAHTRLLPYSPTESVSNTWKLFKMEHMRRLAKDNNALWHGFSSWLQVLF